MLWKFVKLLETFPALAQSSSGAVEGFRQKPAGLKELLLSVLRQVDARVEDLVTLW